MKRLNVLQGDLVYVKHPNKEREGWYQKLRAENKKVRYFKLYPVCTDGQMKVYSPLTLEDPYSYSEAEITMILNGGDIVADFIRSGYNFDLIRDLVRYIEIEKLESQVDGLKNNYVIKEIERLEEEIKKMRQKYAS